MKHIVSYSGGKDSTAMLVRMIEMGMPIDDIVFINVMATPDMGAEFPEMYEYLKKVERVPFPKKQTQKKLRKPNEAKEINQPAQSGKQNAREPATPKQSGDANDYKKPQCTQKCRPEPELGKQNAAGE